MASLQAHWEPFAVLRLAQSVALLQGLRHALNKTNAIRTTNVHLVDTDALAKEGCNAHSASQCKERDSTLLSLFWKS